MQGSSRSGSAWRRRGLVGAFVVGLVSIACDGAAGGGGGGARATPSPPSPAPAQVEALASSEGEEKARCADHSGIDPAALPSLPETPYTRTFEQVWEIVRLKYFDPTIACLDWPAIRVEYGVKLASAADTTTAYAVIDAMLGRLGQSHFRVLPPGGDEDAPRGSASAPLHVRWIDDRVIVVDGAVGGRPSGVPAGAELVSIDGRLVAEVVERARAKSERPSELAFEVSLGVHRRLMGEDGAPRLVRFLEPGPRGKEREVEVKCVPPAGESVSLGNLHDVPTRVEWRMVAGTKVGYLAFNYWMLPMVKRVEAAMGDLRGAGMEALILDLRGNPGGVGAMSVPVARMILREDGSLGTLHFRDFKQEFKVSGNPDAFAGEVVLLVDEGTASTSEIFATGLRDLGRVRIVGGRASAGAALPSLIERLDGGATLQYVVGDYHSSKGSVAEGDGVAPDLVVREAREDFAAGRDPVLDAAVRLLTERNP